MAAFPRRMVILRHAESMPPRSDGSGDHARLLTSKGCADARAAAKSMQKALADKAFPAVAICSDASRARQTLAEMTEEVSALKGASQHFESSIYAGAAMDGTTRALLTDLVSKHAPVDAETVLCIGHNKGWEEAASEFSGKEVKLHPGSFALLESRPHATWLAALEDLPWTLVEVSHPPAEVSQ
mmetsp:Transcript_3502/g.22006  ORF Transcript_3502/g.22006 Transcript_3502/m.22006 type:complete len:184 (-) Transcript_3502:52-603(-)